MKLEINPMQSAHKARRCSAHSKRTGEPCGSPAVTGWRVCRMHGARGGAPSGKGNGRYKSGEHTRDAMAAQLRTRHLIAECNKFLNRL